MTTCAICHREASDGQHACPYHADELRAWLQELPRQAELLETEFVAPAGRPREGRLGGTGRAHAPAPVDLRVLTLLGPGRYDPNPGTDDDGTAPITATLGAWAGYIAYTYPAVHRDQHSTQHVRPCDHAVPRHPGPTITGWCAWLTAYLPYATTHPWVADLHRGLGGLLHRIRDLTHAVPHRHPMAAPCPSCEAFRLVRVDGQWHITCSLCGHHLTPGEYEQHAARFLQTAGKIQN